MLGFVFCCGAAAVERSMRKKEFVCMYQCCPFSVFLCAFQKKMQKIDDDAIGLHKNVISQKNLENKSRSCLSCLQLLSEYSYL
jgi:hypothetical protein